MGVRGSVRYTSQTTTISHDNNNHASTSWRSDGSPSCLDGSITRVGRGQNPQYTGAHFGGEAIGLLTSTPTHNNESEKPQNNVVAEQVLRGLLVRRASVMRSLGAQNSMCPWSVQMFLMCNAA